MTSIFRFAPWRAAAAAAAGLLALGLLGCGGGGAGGGFPTVSNMIASPAAYGRTMTISVSGSGLGNGASLVLDRGCDGLAKVTGSNDAQLQYTCKVSALGVMRFGLNNADGRELASLAVNIPPPQVTVTTSMGTFVVQLDPDKAPKTVNNFLTYVNAGFYTNVIFHRVIPTRVIQAGGYTAGPTPKATSLTAIPLESNNGLLNLRGTIAMARLTAPNTATSQFYINVADNTSLNYVDDTNPGYAVFGTVVSGMDVIDAINVVPTQVLEAKGLSDVPVADVTITQAFQNQ